MYVEVAQSQSNALLPAAEALAKGLISEDIPAKGHLITQGLDPGAIYIGIRRRE